MIINFRGLEGEALDILSRKTIKSLGELQIISYYLSSQGFSEEEIKKKLADYKWKLSFPGVSSDSLIELCLRVQEPPAAMKGDFSEVKIFQSEIDFIRDTMGDDTRKLLFLFLVISKWNNHTTGWIRYERDFLFKFWKIKANEKQKEALIRDCCYNGIELRVIGSKHPVACFKVHFRAVDADPVRVITNPEEIKDCYYELIEGRVK